MEYNLLNIKTLCYKKNITFLELSRRIKKTEQGLYKSITTNSINIKTLAEIADVLEVCVSELIADSKYNEAKHNVTNKELSSIKITDANEYIVNRFEEVVCENGKLKERVIQYEEKIRNLEENTRGNYSLQDVPALKVAEE